MNTNDIKIIHTTFEDCDMIMAFFQKAMELQGKNGYKVWTEIDEVGLKKDIKNQLQYKILRNDEVLCIFSLQFSDPLTSNRFIP